MQKKVVRIFSGLLAIVILSVVIVPASADFGGGISRSDFFTWTDGFGGGSFGGGAGREQSKTAYDDYVQTLPATGYTSTGNLIWQPTWKNITLFGLSQISGNLLDIYTFDLSSTVFSFSDRFDSLPGTAVIRIGSLPYYGVYRVFAPLEYHYRY